MSISSEIARISGNVEDAFEAIEDKGVTVPSGSTSDDLADLISQISGGGSIVISDTTDSAGGTIRTITATTVRMQSKSNISPTTSSQTIEPDNGYTGLSSVQINAVPTGSATAPSTITGSSASVSTGTNTLTLSKMVSVTPSVTTAGYVSSGTAGNSSVSLTASVTTQAAQTIHPSTSDQSIGASRYLTGAQTIKAVALSNLTADNIKAGVTVKVGDSTDDDCVASVTGTYEGGGGTAKNTQVMQSTSRTTATSLTKVLGDMTISKTGTYDVYWSGARTNTSSSYTWGTRLYIDGTAYGTENTTWSNNVQSNHLSNVSLTANQKLSVYARGRGGNYYACVPMLTIVEA